MAKNSNTGAARFLPAERTLPALRAAARECQGCELYRNATQTVFGTGAADAALMLVGEQPGDQEDRAGAPFVGPAGRILDRGLADAGITRDQVYLTNAVKHFKFQIQGKRRIHRTPGVTELRACRPWLEAELDLVRPRVTVALGATAARALLGPGFRVTRERGRPLPGAHGRPGYVLATIHPSAVLRAPDQDAAYAGFLADLTAVARVLDSP